MSNSIYQGLHLNVSLPTGVEIV